MRQQILVIDDDASLLKLYDAALSSRGYQVLTADNGEAALTIVEKEKPDLILLDIMMPAIHGLHVLDILKATPGTKDIKIMMLTALGDEATKQKALEAGAIDYIVKSQSNISEILEKIDGALS